jgi:tetratricopeptide (TPR) repeat protein
MRMPIAFPPMRVLVFRWCRRQTIPVAGSIAGPHCLLRNPLSRIDLTSVSIPNASPDAARLDQVLAGYRRMLDAELTSPAALNHRAVELMRAGANEDALTCFECAAAIEQDSATARFNCGHVLDLLGRHDAALVNYRRALALGLNIPDIHHRIGILLHELGNAEQAVASYDLALAMESPAPLLLNSRGYALHSLGRLTEAKADYERALALQPDLSMARLNLGITCLAMGEWEQGWAGYEARWRGAHETGKGIFLAPATPLPQWHGEIVSEKDHLLVFSEQGMGDSLQFSRYLLLAAQRFARVSFVCPAPLVRLFQQTFSPTIEILTVHPTDQSAWQWQCPLMSLPMAFGTTLENVPASASYLTLKPEWSGQWQQRLAAVERRPRIGLTWAGFKGHKSDAIRSIPLVKFSALLARTDVVWISLQKDDGAEQRTAVPAAGMLDWTNDIGDFADTAALISQLDLVISIDTSVAHLAGALGKPVWMLNRFESEWRWLRDREDSPWYPGMRIFNQKRARDWDEVLARVDTAITKITKHDARHASQNPKELTST